MIIVVVERAISERERERVCVTSQPNTGWALTPGGGQQSFLQSLNERKKERKKERESVCVCVA